MDLMHSFVHHASFCRTRGIPAHAEIIPSICVRTNLVLNWGEIRHPPQKKRKVRKSVLLFRKSVYTHLYIQELLLVQKHAG